MRPFGNSSNRWTVDCRIGMSVLLNGLLVALIVAMSDVMVMSLPVSAQITGYDNAKKCLYSRTHNMLQVQCKSMELKEVPSTLRSSIQVLDASTNRMRELTNDSLTPYKSLAYIYLADNFIQNIEEAAFANQPYLEVLDLTKNGLDSMPKSLFHLPYFRTLYLGDNKFTDSSLKVDVTSPISILHLEKNKLTKLPEIGVQLSLVVLNVSDNLITSMRTEDLAPFCSLKILDLTRNPIRFNGGDCKCQTLNAWLKLREIKVKPGLFNCTDSSVNEECADVQFSNQTYEMYNNCSNIIQQKAETEKARSKWIIVASSGSVIIFFIGVILYCVHKKNVRRRRQREEQQEQQQLAANNANTELLNGNLKPGNS